MSRMKLRQKRSELAVHLSMGDIQKFSHFAMPIFARVDSFHNVSSSIEV